MKTTTLTVLSLLLLSCTLTTTSAEPTLYLNWNLNSGFTLKTGINGAWTINPTYIDNATISNATYIEFYIDNQLQKNDTTTPFSWSFNTDNYPEGTHTIKAIAYNTIGESATTEEQRNFVGFPLISVIGAILFASILFAFVLVISWFWIQKKAHARRIQKATCSN